MAEKTLEDVLQTPDSVDLHHRNVAPYICKRLAVESCIIVSTNPDGTMNIAQHGASHAKINSMLSRAIQLNLNAHDDAVRQGAAGAEAQAAQKAIDGGAA